MALVGNIGGWNAQNAFRSASFLVQSTWEDANGEPVGMAAQQLMRSLPGHMIRALEVAQAEATAANDLAQVPAALQHTHAACFDEQSGAACHCPQPSGVGVEVTSGNAWLCVGRRSHCACQSCCDPANPKLVAVGKLGAAVVLHGKVRFIEEPGQT